MLESFDTNRKIVEISLMNSSLLEEHSGARRTMLGLGEFKCLWEAVL